jgi:hypothetical protein
MAPVTMRPSGTIPLEAILHGARPVIRQMTSDAVCSMWLLSWWRLIHEDETTVAEDAGLAYMASVHHPALFKSCGRPMSTVVKVDSELGMPSARYVIDAALAGRRV